MLSTESKVSLAPYNSLVDAEGVERSWNLFSSKGYFLTFPILADQDQFLVMMVTTVTKMTMLLTKIMMMLKQHPSLIQCILLSWRAEPGFRAPQKIQGFPEDAI